MLKAVLLDLDNTLILFDEPAFYARFFDRMTAFFEDIMPTEELTRRTLAATMALKDNAGAMSNRDWFTRAFDDGAELPMARIWERWLDFYRDRYGPFGIDIAIPEGQAEVVSDLAQRGLSLVIASNPIFPPIALARRMAWGGIDPEPFSLLTHMENMSFVKPHAGYYRSISEMIGIAPSDCLMVGNDPVNDMAAGAIGMKTYLTTDASESDFASLTMGSGAVVDRPQSDFSGPLSRVCDAVDDLLSRP
jgi:FMN phosphatase YigB (HAD superfamily)